MAQRSGKVGVVISTYIKSTQTFLVDRVVEVVGMDQNSSRGEVMTFSAWRILGCKWKDIRQRLWIS